jgi:hypothetical protein
MTSKSVEEVLESIRRSLPTRDLVNVPEGASVLDQLQILQQLVVSNNSNRTARSEQIRRSVRDEWFESDSKRGSYSATVAVLSDLSDNRRERQKMKLEEERKDTDIVSELESRQRRREMNERSKRLKERKKEYKSTIVGYAFSVSVC